MAQRALAVCVAAAGALAVLFAALVTPAAAQTFPSKTVRIIAPF